AGPAGVAVGASAGMLGGMTADIAIVGVGADFLQDVGEQLTPGRSAVVAEIEEEWVTPVDTREEKLGGVVMRRARSEVVDYQDRRDIAALNAELDDMKNEFNRTTGEAKAKLQSKMEATKAKLAQKQEKAKGSIESAKKHAEAKLNSMQ